MKELNRINCLVLLMLLIGSCSFAQIDIEREALFQVPDELQNGLLGMRSAGGKIFLASSSGRFVRYDLETREAFTGKIQADRLIDYDVVLGQLVYLDASGKIGGRTRSSWPDRTYQATTLEVCNEGLVLAGGDSTFFLAKNATDVAEIKQMHFALPISNGFLWTLQIRPKTGVWGVDLYDCLGNLMKEVYSFSSEFSPTGLEVGPAGPEGEILISAYENNERALSLIANNGHMFWKIAGPARICSRDLAFDPQGNLLVLERKDRQLWVNRWKFAVPEG